ncbi:hypothetical protein C438_00490 [Haloferax denitrificans ATCC 35960]|uniref:Uncharacterized protein n=1 Tax=Haloferax denitrificans ATCC 35960 TaxID=662478 RepID=M0JIS8_9EURY|nr:hypothetical protein C438_00490 [Haloferax denitrificans ATCC 35960]
MTFNQSFYEVWFDDSISVDDDAFAADDMFCFEECVSGPSWIFLDNVLDVDSPVTTIFKVTLDPLSFVADDEDDVVDSRRRDRFDDVL